MTKGVQFRRGDSTSHASFTGRQGEITVNTDKKVAVVHDNSKQGGYELVGVAVTQELSNKTFSGVTTFSSAVITGVTTIGVGSIGNVIVSGALTATTLNSTAGIVTNFRVTGVSTFEANTSGSVLRITQLGSGNAIVVEDSTNPDATPFIVDAMGDVGIGTITAPYPLSVVGSAATASTPGLTGAVADFTSNVSGYSQINVRNTNNGTTSSGDIIVTADTGNDSDNYIDFGINNSGFTTSSDWSITGGLDGYLYTSTKNLIIGAAAANQRLGLFAGGLDPASEKLSVTTNGVGFGITNPVAFVSIQAGTASTSPLKFHSNFDTLLSVAQTGAIEYAAEGFYGTASATLGRGSIPTETYYRLNANRVAIGATITNQLSLASIGATNFFGNSIPLASGKTYEIDAHLYLQRGAIAGITTITLVTHNGSPTSLSYFATYSPIAGVSSAAAQAPLYFGQTGLGGTVTLNTTGILAASVNHQFTYKILIDNNTANAFSFGVGSTAAVTPLRGSYWRIKQLPSAIGVGATSGPTV